VDGETTARYLRRIGFPAPPAARLDTLEALQRARLSAVPFENLDVYLGRDAPFEDDRAVTKILERGRGGWCFELNGAFARLLEAVGFPVTRLAATALVGAVSPMPDHLTLRVDLERPYLVDVGFGMHTPIRPLPLDDPGPHDGGIGEYHLLPDGAGGLRLERRRRNGAWAGCFRLDPRPVEDLGVFAAAARHLATTPGTFTDAPFAVRLLDGGPDRLVLTRDRIGVLGPRGRTDRPVPPEAWVATLRRRFGIDVPEGVATRRLP